MNRNITEQELFLITLLYTVNDTLIFYGCIYLICYYVLDCGIFEHNGAFQSEFVYFDKVCESFTAYNYIQRAANLHSVKVNMQDSFRGYMLVNLLNLTIFPNPFS